MVDPRFDAKGRKIPPIKCLDCGIDGMDAASRDDNHRPEPGSVTVCYACGHVMIFDENMKMRNPTDEEVVEMAGDPDLLRMQKKAAEFREWREQRRMQEAIKDLTLDQLLDMVKKQAEMVLVGAPAGTQVDPIFLMVSKTGKIGFISTRWSNADERELMSRAIRQEMKKEGVIKYSFMSEAWAAKAKEGWKKGMDFTPPSLRDDRMEIVMGVAAEKGHSEMKTWKIVRGQNGRVTKLVEEQAGEVALSGRFINMLD